MIVVIGFNWPVEHDHAVGVIVDGELVLLVRRRGGRGTSTRRENH